MSSNPQSANGNPRFIDTHAHLASPEFAADILGLLERAEDAGLAAIVAIGTDAEDSRRVVGIARHFDRIHAAVGIHPNEAAAARPGDWDEIETLAVAHKVVALGETGLDRYRDRTPFALQREWFDRHLDLAESLGRPVVIHCRQSEEDIIEQLARRGRPIRGVLHSFTGTATHARAFLDLGLHLSFAGQITFTNKSLDPLRAVAGEVPLDRLLIETDSPYLTPHPFRGQSNEPARVALTAARLAELRGLPLDELANATTVNARLLFGLSEPGDRPQNRRGR